MTLYKYCPFPFLFLALHLLSQIHQKFNSPLDVAHLDIKAAFDSMTVMHCGRLCTVDVSQLCLENSLLLIYVDTVQRRWR